METTTLEPTTSTVGAPQAPQAPQAPAPGTGAERRRAAREAHAARLISGTKLLSLTERAERQERGFSGREGYSAWLAETGDAVRDALDGQTVEMTLSPVSSSKAGSRCMVSGVADVAGRTVALRGEATIRDIADNRTLTGATVSVRLSLGHTLKGTPVLRGESHGLSSTGQRIGLTCRVQAMRKVFVAASAL